MGYPTSTDLKFSYYFTFFMTVFVTFQIEIRFSTELHGNSKLSMTSCPPSSAVGLEILLRFRFLCGSVSLCTHRFSIVRGVKVVIHINRKPAQCMNLHFHMKILNSKICYCFIRDLLREKGRCAEATDILVSSQTDTCRILSTTRSSKICFDYHLWFLLRGYCISYPKKL